MKAVLVVDMPKSCYDCKFCSKKDYSECEALAIKEGRNHFNYFEYWNSQKPSWCPLRPLPKKKIVLEHRIGGYTVNGIEMAEAHGWNKCLDEITGETE